MKPISVLLVLMVCVQGLRAHCLGGSDRVRFVANRAEVLDRHTGLTWARCSVGQEWSGQTCEGQPSLFAQGCAQTLAAANARLAFAGRAGNDVADPIQVHRPSDG